MESKPMNGSTSAEWSDQQLCDFAARMAQAAGDLVGGALQNVRTIDTKSSGTDFVTEMDRAAEALLLSMIDAERPDDGILGEEGSSRPGTSGIRWVVDPIDGTTNYVYRHPLFSVSVGCERNGIGVAGAVAVPMLRELFTGWLGGGAYCNGKPIKVTDETVLSKTLVGTGFAYLPEPRAAQGRRLAALLGDIGEMRRGGSAAIDLCFVAAARLDAYYQDGLQPWDECAGLVIAAEAGASITRLAMSEEVLLVSNPGVHDQLADRLIAIG
jgi:myo-inositol-1(or 4)-monophosphatase